MTVDIQKAAIRRLLDSQNTDLYNKLGHKFFSDSNLLLFRSIQNFYETYTRIPSAQEFIEYQKSQSNREYLDTHIMSSEAEAPYMTSDFLSNQLQDWYLREETIKWLGQFIDQLENLEGTEIIDKVQSHVLQLHQFLPEGEELFDVANLDPLHENVGFTMYSSGLSNEYDAVNGGFALQELIMFGGRRGSGKSIITLNAALHQFLTNQNSVAFFSIEMRYIEVYYRLMSMISGVPFMKFMKQELTHQDKLTVAKARINTFFEYSDEVPKILEAFDKDEDHVKLNINLKKLQYKPKRFHIIDDVNLTIPRIDHYLNVLTNKYNVKASVVDYLNIIKTEDRMDWKSQIGLADSLKVLSRKYDQMLMSPYQIDQTGEARFAKGVLDSADRSFRFTPADLDDDPDILPFEITKIRNGKSMKFPVYINWECLKVLPERSTKQLEGKILNKYGKDNVEYSGDLG